MYVELKSLVVVQVYKQNKKLNFLLKGIKEREEANSPQSEGSSRGGETSQERKEARKGRQTSKDRQKGRQKGRQS